jgi:hypothetical protein
VVQALVTDPHGFATTVGLPHQPGGANGLTFIDLYRGEATPVPGDLWRRWVSKAIGSAGSSWERSDRDYAQELLDRMSGLMTAEEAGQVASWLAERFPFLGQPWLQRRHGVDCEDFVTPVPVWRPELDANYDLPFAVRAELWHYAASGDVLETG